MKCPYCSEETSSVIMRCEKCGQDLSAHMKALDDQAKVRGKRESNRRWIPRLIQAIAGLTVGLASLALVSTGDYEFKYGVFGFIFCVGLIIYGIVMFILFITALVSKPIQPIMAATAAGETKTACPHCGKPVFADASGCGNCGAKLA